MTLGYKQRLGVLAVLSAAGALLLWVWLFRLQVLNYTEFAKEAQRHNSTKMDIAGRRGLILDSKGRVLAKDAPSYDLYFVPDEWDSIPFICPHCGTAAVYRLDPKRKSWTDRCKNRRCRAVIHLRDRRNLGPLALLLQTTVGDLLHRMQGVRVKAQEAVDKHLGGFKGTERAEKQLREEYTRDYFHRAWPYESDVSYDVVREVTLHPERAPGFRIHVRWRRRYPRGGDFVHVVGYLGWVSKKAGAKKLVHVYGGVRGIEKFCDDALSAHAGSVTKRRDPATGEVVVARRVPPRNGETVQLTIDAADQRLAQDTLAGTDGQYGEAALIVVDANTGAVLAMASAPTFDPRDKSKVAKEWYRRQEGPPPHGSPLLDRASREVAMPGSTMKTFTAIAALAAGVTTPDRIISCDGYLHIGDRIVRGRLRCHGVHGDTDLHTALVKSCNVYFETLMLDDGFFPKFARMGRAFGFGEPTGLETEYRTRHGRFPAADGKWPRQLRIPAGTGQGDLKVTPAQLARAYAGVCTGRLPRLHLVARIGDRVVAPPSTPLPVGESDLAPVRAALADVARPGGTAGHYGLDRWNLHCKTGTAVLHHGEAFNDSWIAGYAPAQSGRPAIAFAMVVCDTRSMSGGACGLRLHDFFQAFYREAKE